MKISSKLYLSFGIIVAFFVAFAIFAPIQMSSLSSYLEGIKNEQLKKVLLLTDIKENQNIIARSLRNLLLSNDTKVIEQEWERVLNARVSIGKSLEDINSNVRSDKDKSIMNEILSLRTKYIDGQNKLYELKKQNKVDEAVNFLTNEFRSVQNEYFNHINDYLQYELKLVDQAIYSGNNLAGFSQKIFMIAGFIIVVVGIVFASVISRSVTKPLNKAVEASDKISHGNTNVDLDTKSKDETAILMTAMKKMVENSSSM
ncbi:MAG: MCP four helix bundle domain-containing protein, partial [Candidatus Kapaibacteriota bacterium]